MNKTIKAIKHKEYIEKNINALCRLISIDDDALSDYIYFIVQDIQHSLTEMVDLVDIKEIAE